MGFLAAAAPVLSLAGTAIGAFGAIQQGQAQEAALNYQAQVARNNAVIAGEYAQAATKAGETQAYNEGLANRAKVGRLVAGLAASGVDVNTGSAAQAREGEQATTYTDVETIRQDAALKAFGYNVEGASQNAQAGLLSSEGGQAGSAGFLKAGGLLFSGLSTVSPKFAGLFNSANSGIGDAASSGFASGVSFSPDIAFSG